MKFASYQRVVTPNTINPPAYKAPGDLQVYGTGGKEFDSLGGALGQINKVALKIQDDQDSSALMDARNKIMTRLTDGLYGEEGLFTTGVGENAAGLSERTHDFIKETFDDVVNEGRYNGRVRRALESNLNDNFNNYHRIAASQETREREGVDKANYTGALSLEVQNAGLTWNVKGSLTNTLRNIETLAYAHGQKYGLSGMAIQSEIRENVTKAVTAAYNQALAEGDYTRADEIARNMRKYINTDTYSKMHGTVKKYQDIQQVNNDAQELYNKYFDPATGKVDYEGLRKEIKQRSTRKQSVGSNDKEAFYAAVEQQESGGDMSAVNPTSGARGVYQIMPGNWASWSKEAGLAGASMDDEAAYRQVGRFKMGQYFDKYGPEGALVAWYAGENNAQRWVNGEPDAIGENGQHYSWDAPQSGGPSVRGYVQETMSRYHPTGNSGGSWSPDKTIYYQVAPGKEGEVEGLQHNTWMKLQALAAKYQAQFGNDADFEPFYVTAASAQEGHNTDSWHYSGQAFDIAMDSLKRHPERLQWLQEHAQDVGLVPLNEYNGYGNEQYADGENFHFSDHGEPFDESSMQGMSGGSTPGATYYDPEYESKLNSQVNALIADGQKQYTQNHKDYLENIGTAIENAGGYANAKTVIEQADLTLQERNSLMSQARSYYGVSVTGKPYGSSRSSGSGSSRQYVYGNSGARYTQNQINDAESNYEEYQERMADPNDTISRTDQRRYNKATRILNDVSGATGDNLANADALKMARHAVAVTANDEEAEWYLISNYNYSESEAQAYVDMVHGSPED